MIRLNENKETNQILGNVMLIGTGCFGALKNRFSKRHRNAKNSTAVSTLSPTLQVRDVKAIPITIAEHFQPTSDVSNVLYRENPNEHGSLSFLGRSFNQQLADLEHMMNDWNHYDFGSSKVLDPASPESLSYESPVLETLKSISTVTNYDESSLERNRETVVPLKYGMDLVIDEFFLTRAVPEDDDDDDDDELSIDELIEALKYLERECDLLLKKVD